MKSFRETIKAVLAVEDVIGVHTYNAKKSVDIDENELGFLDSVIIEASKDEALRIMQFMAVMVWKGGPVALNVIADATHVKLDDASNILTQLDKIKMVQFDGKKAQITKKGSAKMKTISISVKEEMKNQTTTCFVEHGEVLPEAELALSFLSTVNFGVCFEAEEEGIESLSGSAILERIDMTALAESYVNYVDMSTLDGSMTETLQRAAVASLLGVDFDGGVVTDLSESEDLNEKGLRLSEVANMLGKLLSVSTVMRAVEAPNLAEVTQCHCKALVAAADNAVPSKVEEKAEAKGIVIAEGEICSICELDLTDLKKCVLCEDDEGAKRVPSASVALLEKPFVFGQACELTQLDENDKETPLSFKAALTKAGEEVEEKPVSVKPVVVDEMLDIGLGIAESIVGAMHSTTAVDK